MNGQREGYYNYMARKLKEEKEKDELAYTINVSTYPHNDNAWSRYWDNTNTTVTFNNSGLKNNGLSKEKEALVVLAEECGELTQACMKILRQGIPSKESYKDLAEEVGDVQCLINKLVDLSLVTQEDISLRVVAKREKLKKWSSLYD